jgi:hypothetical protein
MLSKLPCDAETDADAEATCSVDCALVDPASARSTAADADPSLAAVSPWAKTLDKAAAASVKVLKYEITINPYVV